MRIEQEFWDISILNESCLRIVFLCFETLKKILTLHVIIPINNARNRPNIHEISAKFGYPLDALPRKAFV